jgi:hypothetical protein
LFCNQNCNQTCCDKKINDRKCEKCGSSNGDYGNKYMIKNSIPDFTTTTEEIITAHPTRSSTSIETKILPSTTIDTSSLPISTTISFTTPFTTPTLDTTSLPETTTTASASIITSSVTITTSKFPKFPVYYGCVRFEKAGEIYFKLEKDNIKNCVSECLIKNPDFNFFITSYFIK